MIFRHALPEEAPQVAAMFRDLALHIQKTSRDPYWDFPDFPVEMAIPAVEEYIREPERAAIVAQEGDELVGMVLLEVVGCHMPLSSHNRIGYVAAGFVKDGFRRKGVMKGLDEKTQEFFRSLGIRFVEVNYLPENTGAKEAWNALGYGCFREQARKQLF